MRAEFEEMVRGFRRQVDTTMSSTNQAVGALRSDVGALQTHVGTVTQQSLESLHVKVDAIAAAGQQLDTAVTGEPNTPEAESGTAAAGAGDAPSAATEGDAKA
jgi:hypothetical protein